VEGLRAEAIADDANIVPSFWHFHLVDI
jgi:hypothetical protein